MALPMTRLGKGQRLPLRLAEAFLGYPFLRSNSEACSQQMWVLTSPVPLWGPVDSYRIQGRHLLRASALPSQARSMDGCPRWCDRGHTSATPFCTSLDRQGSATYLFYGPLHPNIELTKIHSGKKSKVSMHSHCYSGF